MAGFLPMSLTTSVAIPMDVAPRTLTRDISSPRARVSGGLPPLGPHSKGEEKARHCPRGGRKGGMCGVWRLVALATVGGDIRRLFSPVGGGSNNKRTNTSTGTRPKIGKRGTRTQASQSTRGKRRTLTSVLSLYLGVGCCCLFQAVDASLDCHLRLC